MGFVVVWELVPNVAKPSGVAPGDCEWALSARKLQPRNGWMAGEGKASGGDRQPGGHEHLSWTESDTSAQCWPFASAVSPPAARGPGESSWAGEPVAGCSSIDAITSFQALGWLRHTDVPTNQGLLFGGSAKEKLG